MNKSKLLVLLKTFSPEEMKKLGEFLHSPYFNKNKTILGYFSELKKHYPGFEPDKLTREKVYEKLFPGKKYNEQVMRNLTSDLNKHCKDFLMLELGKKDVFEGRLNLLKQLILRKADSIFYNELNIFEKELKKVSEMSERNFYYLYQLEDVKISFHLERNEQPLVFNNVLKSGEYLILFFLLNLTKTISNLNVNKQSFNVKYGVNLPEKFFNNIGIEEIISYMKDNKIEFSELAELYFYRILCNSYPYDEKYYYTFKNLVLKNLNSLGKIEIYGLFNALETFCLIKINSGNSKFVSELFEIFNLEMKKGFYKYSDSSPLTYMKFRNTYLSAVTLKKFDWMERFISEYKNDIIEPHRENIVKIANAQLHFEKGNFEMVLENISDIRTNMVYLKIDIRNLTLMTYYELNYTESVLSLIDSFRHFLSVNKSMTEVFKESHLRFINSLYSLVIFKEKNQIEKLSMLKDSLKLHTNERRIVWLIEKIRQIINNR